MMVDKELAGKSVGELWNMIEELQAERDRYREALEKTQAWSAVYQQPLISPEQTIGVINHEARTALAGKE